MRNIIIGFVLGIVVATVGFSGVARIWTMVLVRSKRTAENWLSKMGKKSLDCG